MRTWEPFEIAVAVLVSMVVFVIGAAIIISAVGSHNGDPFQARCDKRGGVVATASYGKMSTDYCIVDNQVVETR